MAYIAKRRKCGCVVMCAVDDGNHLDDLANEVASCIRDGLIVERVTIEDARLSKFGCDHQDKQLELFGEKVG